MTLDELNDLLITTGIPVFHYNAALQELPYIVYTEYQEIQLRAENKIKGSYFLVQVDYYTETDKDQNVTVIYNLLNDNEIPFEYKLIYQHEDDTLHHVFDCSLL